MRLIDNHALAQYHQRELVQTMIDADVDVVMDTTVVCIH
jgi:hypothetical protein